MKSVNVFGRKVPVLLENGLFEQGYAGCYDDETYEITLDARLKGEKYMEILLHEIGHAIFGRGGLDHAMIPPQIQEVIVQQYAAVLLDNFRLTPKKKV